MAEYQVEKSSATVSHKLHKYIYTCLVFISNKCLPSFQPIFVAWALLEKICACMEFVQMHPPLVLKLVCALRDGCEIMSCIILRGVVCPILGQFFLCRWGFSPQSSPWRYFSTNLKLPVGRYSNAWQQTWYTM